MCDAINEDETINPKQSSRKVLGIDIDIRAHNRKAIEKHPMASRIEMIEGSSIAPEIVNQVTDIAGDYKNIIVCLDSNHTHEHVLAELKAYAPLTSLGSYCIVMDTVMKTCPPTGSLTDFKLANSPKTVVYKYLENHSQFEIDRTIQHKLLITVRLMDT